MEQLHGGLTLQLCPGAFPLSTDSMVLSGFVRLGKQAKVLDLGSGCGTLGLLLCADHPDCTVTGVELDENAHAAALENIRTNKLTTRMESICADFTQIHNRLAPGSFTACVSNPPYFAAGPASQTLPTARREDCCTLEALFETAARYIKYGGDFFLVHRPERLAELMACANKTGLEPKRLCLVRHKKTDNVTLILLQCRKGGKPGLQWEEVFLHFDDGSPSEYYRKLYHL